jgi:methyl-accepting chemotaxis protein
MSINRLLSSAILFIALFMTALGGYVMLSKLAAMRSLSTAGTRLDVIRAIGNIPRYLNPERGLVLLLVGTMPPGDQKNSATLAETFHLTDTALEAAQTTIGTDQGQLDDGAEIAGALAEIARIFHDYRQNVDQKLAAPLDQRAGVAGAVMQQTNGLNAIVSKVLRDELRRLAAEGGQAYRNVDFAGQVWSLREVGGMHAAQLSIVVNSAKPPTPEQRLQIQSLRGQVEHAWSVLSPMLDDPATPADVATALAAVKSVYIEGYLAEVKKMEAAFDTGKYPYTAAAWREVSAKVWPAIIGLREAFYDLAAREIGAAHAAAVFEAIVAGTMLLVALAVAGGVLVIIHRRVTAPLAAMTGAMRQIAAGELGTAIPGTGRTDEIGEMAKAVVVFRDTAAEKLARDRELDDERVRGDGERRRSEAQAIERERQLVAGVIGGGLAKLAGKDLTYRMTSDLPEAYRRLQADFNQAVQQLEAAMLEVARNVHAIEAGSHQITSAADDLSQRTEQQAASLEETAAALEEITATVDQTADGARNANTLVASAKTDAEKGGEVVRAAIAAMSGIEKSSKQIGQIIAVIDEIAFQTNLLALNAGVEAARAGDAGRGFAVVASEVRALAQRSAEAAKEIKSLISASTAQVDVGVGLVADSGKSLERIVGQIADVSKVVAAIAAGATEQATALKEVNSAVSQMDHVTQRNAAMVEETTAASHNLMKETQSLMGALSRFQVSAKGAASQYAKPVSRPGPAAASRGAAAGRRAQA